MDLYDIAKMVKIAWNMMGNIMVNNENIWWLYGGYMVVIYSSIFHTDYSYTMAYYILCHDVAKVSFRCS